MRLIIGTLSVIAILLVAAVVGPSFVDWNKYKPQIITQVKKATGYDVTIDGEISMAVLPAPHVKISDVTINAPRKVKFDTLLKMKSAEVSVELAPLFSKKIVVDSVTLVEPVVNVEIMEDGTGSWVTQKLGGDTEDPQEVAEQVEANDAQTPPSQKATDAISLNALTIENGALDFIDHRSGAAHSAKEINLDLEADSLKGPFEADGSLVYQEKKITLDIETGKLPAADEALKISANMEIPDADTEVSFNGVASIKAPFDAQGETSFKTGSVQEMAALFGAALPAAYDETLSLDGLLTADQSQINYNDLKFSFGDFVSNGKISVTNLTEKNPVKISGNLKSSSALDLNPFMQGSAKKTANSNTDLKNAGKAGTQNNGGLVPNSLTLPMPVDVSFALDVGGLKIKDHEAKGVFVDINKTGPKAKVTFRAMEVPGQASANGTVNVAYASSSRSPKSGQVIYTDPTAQYKVNGQIGQLATFLKAFAPQADTKAITNLYKTAQFDLDGSINQNTVSLKDSTLKLDEMVVGLGGSYQPARNGGRAKATIDVSAGSVDFDRIKQAAGGSKSQAAPGGSGEGKKSSPKEALAPVRNLSVPMDLTFDVSLQKARINNADLEGLRLTGSLIGNKLSLTNASVNNYAGATMSVKGQVNDLQALSGIDLTAYTKTSDVKRLAQAFKVDTSKFPASLNALEASVAGKGSLDNLTFTSNAKAMGGQLDVSGIAANPLENLALSNLSIGLKHPNMVNAIQIIKPEFQGATGLAQPVDFFSNAKLEGKTYTLSGMKMTLGSSNLGGDLTINTGSNIPSIRGNIQAGKIALDDLVGAKKSSGSGASGGGGSAGSGTSASSGKWSKTPINLKWMNSVDVDVKLAATSITYGSWNFLNPSTDLKIANGVMNVSGLKAGVFGGQANLTSEVKAQPVSMTLSTSMNEIDLESLTKALSGSSRLQSTGKVSFKADVGGTGNSSFDLISSLNGSANLDGTNVILKGFDLAKLARGLAVEEKLATSITSFIDGAMSGGQTQFDTINGAYNIANGIVKIQSMKMDGPAALIESTGAADLPKWYVNVDNKITLKNVPDLDPLSVKIKGSISNPQDTFGKNILEDYLQDKIRRKIGKELPNILGDDVSEKLQKFGILPQQQAPAPTPSTGGSEAPAEAQPAPQPEPEKIEKPEDALNQFMKNPDDPEKAVRDVLKGLF